MQIYILYNKMLYYDLLILMLVYNIEFNCFVLIFTIIHIQYVCIFIN